MKTLLSLAACFCSVQAMAQTSTLPITQQEGTNDAEVGPDYRTLPPDRDSLAASANFGSVPVPAKRGRVIEIATGLNYWDGATWSQSIPSFEVSEQDGSFVAARVQHATSLSADINVAGAVSVKAANQVLSSSPIGIGLYDAMSGQFLLIGSITNCAGVLLSSNQVYYPHANLPAGNSE